MKEKEESFEELMVKLEEIANQLESGKLNLDDSVKAFEEGIEISKQCNKKLENAEKRIHILVQKDGEIEEENFIAE